MHWIFGVKFVDLGDSCTVGGDPAMNIIIAWVPVLNVSEGEHCPPVLLPGSATVSHCRKFRTIATNDNTQSTLRLP